jgi:hypothetical protein
MPPPPGMPAPATSVPCVACFVAAPGPADCEDVGCGDGALWLWQVALYFTRKMIRLVLVLSIGCSVLTGCLVGAIVDWSCMQFVPAILIADPAPNPMSEPLSTSPPPSHVPG